MKKLLKKLRSHFIPHESNEFKPYFLRHQSMVFTLLLVAVVELCFLVQVFVVFDKTGFLAQVLPGVLTSMTNEQRADNSAPKLAVSDVLTRAATMKANDMAAKGYFAHTSPEGLNPWYWFKQVGYDYMYAGENLAVNFFDSKEVATAWMNSPAHRANIVKKDYTEIGIGVATGVYEGRETVFVAQLFGTPTKKVTGNNEKVAQASPIVPATTTPKTQPKTTPKTTTTPKPVVKPAPKTVKVPAVVTKDAQPLATKVLSEESTQEAPQVVSGIGFKNFSLKAFIDRILTSPRGAVTNLYELAALIVFLSIILVRLIRYEHRHFPSVARGVTVIAVIFTLMLVNSSLSQKMTLKLPTNNLEASVINVGY